MATGIASPQYSELECSMELYNHAMDEVKPHRTRRSERAEATRRRVVEAAGRLFVERGYRATTIESIAAAADVSAETIYKRFGNKAGLLKAAREVAVAGAPEPEAFFAFPSAPIDRAISAASGQEAQLRTLADLSSRRIERLAPFHRMLRNAGTGDPELAEFVAGDHAQRRAAQRANIHAIAEATPLRLDEEAAADTYSALANPDVFLMLVDQFGWSAESYRGWLAETVTRLLLADD
jgi:AcrR family transcriptional regulator